VFARNPQSYAAAVALAETRLAAGRSSDRDLLRAALETLADAAKLEGCQNRVKLLQMTTQLELARLARMAGERPQQELEQVLEFCRQHLRVDPDHEGWTRLRDCAEQELGEL